MLDPSNLALDATALAEKLRNREFSATSLVAASLARCNAIASQFNPFTVILDDKAMLQAEAADRAIDTDAPIGPLHGVPIAIKDMTPTLGDPTTLGSYSEPSTLSLQDAEIVARLRRAGAIVVAKTTTSEFAWSAFTRSPRYGTTRNPWNPAHSPGGSSGGSAVAVATHAVALAEGTDMGGSVRIPAAFCGLVGFKPSLGRLPMTLFSSGLDDLSHFGPLAKSVRDAITFTSVTAGPARGDLRSITMPFDKAAAQPRDPRTVRIAVALDLGFYAVDPGVERLITAACQHLAKAGVSIRPVRLGWTRAVVDSWFRLWEVFLAFHFGDRLEKHRDQLDPEVVRLIEKGFATSAVDYRSIEVMRTRLFADLCDVFETADALLCPTCACPPPLGELSDFDFDETLADGRYRGLDMACPFNLVPCPAISLPCGLTSSGLPVGLQLVGPRCADEALLAVAATVEALLPRAPRLSL